MIPLGVLASSYVTPAGGVTLAADTFTRADSTTNMGDAETGGTWATTGTWGIRSNRARCYSADTVASLDVGIASGYRAQVDMLAHNWPGLVVRFTDTNNFYWLEAYSPSGSTIYLELRRRMAGVTVVGLATRTIPTAATTVYVEVNETIGTDFAFWTTENTTPTTYSDTTSGRPAGTRVGLRGQNLATRGEFDNFLVEAL